LEVVIDSRIKAAVVGIVGAVAIFASDRWLHSGQAIAILISCTALFAAETYVLGRTRGAVVALFIAAAVNRYTIEIGGSTIKPEHIVAPLAGLALLPDLRLLVRRLDRVDLLFLAWLGWSVIPGLLNAPDPRNSTKLWMMLLLVAFGYFAVSLTVRTAGRARTIFTAWLAIATSVGIWGLAVHFMYHVFDVDLGIQINPVTLDPSIPGPFREANFFGSTVMMAGLTGIALLAFGGPSRRLAWVATITGLLAVQISFTRTAWISFVGGLVLVVIAKLIFRPRYEPALRPATLGAFGTIAVIAALGTFMLWVPFSHEPGVAVAVAAPQPTVEGTPGPSPTPQPTKSYLEQGTPVVGLVWTPPPGAADITGRLGSIGDTSDRSVELRLAFIRQALRDWREHPVVGLGIGSFGQLYVNSSNEPAWLTMFAIRLLHDGGIIGLAIFSAALAVLAWRVIQLLVRPRASPTERLALAMSIAIAAMFVAFLATEGLQLAWYWCTIGLFAALVRVAVRQPHEGATA